MSFSWLAGLDLIWAVVITTAGYLALLIWSLARPAEEILAGAPDRARWRDLRLWILPLLLIQIGLYWWLR